MPPAGMATPAEAAELINHMMRTRDPRKTGAGMVSTANKAKTPYRNRERAYHVLRIGSLPSREDTPMLNWRQFQKHVNKLLDLVSPYGHQGKRRRDRIQATRKVVKAFLTVTGVNLARDALSIEQENNTLKVSPWAQSLSRRGLPPDTLIYKGHPPLDNAAAVAARDANTEAKELRAVLRKGLGEEPSKDRIYYAGDDRRLDLWRYQATHQFIATVRSGRQEPHLRGWLYDNVTLSTVATPHDATSLWTALS